MSILQDKSKALAFVILVVLSILSISMWVMYKDVEYVTHKTEYELELLRQGKVAYLANVINNEYNKAVEESTIVAESIKTEVNNQYSSTTKLEKDIKTLNHNSPFFAVVNDAINPEAPYNPFIAIHQINSSVDKHGIPNASEFSGILANKNLQQSPLVVDINFRNWRYEIDGSYNQELMEQSVLSLIEIKEGPVFIQVSGDKIQEMSIDEIAKDYEKNGIKALKNYTFYAPAYLGPDKDILGNSYVNHSGIKQEAYMMIVIHEYNLYDIISNQSDVYAQLNEYSVLKESIIHLHDDYVFFKQVQIILTLFALIISFVLTSVVQNKIH